ncbi:ABC transporter ATP-binding protein [Vallitalea pronyensis]|uniref:ABC transporter ATP-binding protein n=1 Tax=Vallitalea pronyensis TaxID=1348613 RepID=A0A8J8MP08_9FIRM|nr:ABC transporter ATP-binding protein [Vallitalea pronyensis]QUI24922.1 ABC transporter ATP-binding protein [Vallitalea pronyensis]
MKKVNVVKIFIKMLPRYARVSLPMFIVLQTLSVAHGIFIGLLAPSMQLFFDRVENYAMGQRPLSAAITGLIILGFVQIGSSIIAGIVQFTRKMYYNRAEGVFSLELHEKINKLPPICFEDTKMLNHMNKAFKGKSESVQFTERIIGSITFFAVYFIIMSAYLFRVKPILIISLLLIFIPVLLTQILRTKFFTKAEDKSAPLRREFDYYENCMTGRAYFKETRLLGAFMFFRKQYKDTLSILNKIRFHAVVKSDLAQLGVQMLSLGGHIGILLLLLNALLNGHISVGAFVAIFASVDAMFHLMTRWICYNLGDVASSFGRVQHYLNFLQIPENNGMDVQVPKNMDISLRDVSFTYPNANLRAVKSISFHIKNGETVAVVGENGSGKSTLIRLITGLYVPDEGDVLYGKINTKEISGRSLFKNISAVFQKFQCYQMTLGDNICISHIDISKDDSGLDKICVQAGLDKNDSQFIDGYNTMLSREFDGVDISGGQWQRIAIARSYYRKHRIIVLDEPTAAIDPIEETRIYNQFAKISKNKTAIIVTHRLGSIKLADRILVMKQGKLVEQGTHAELLTNEGEYARLYKSQERWYKD